VRLSPHFTLRELLASPTADRLGITNAPGLEIVANLGRLADALEQVRALTGQPLRINSGYRCPELNAAVGGSPNSYHMRGLAADFDPPPGWTHDALQQAIAADPDIPFDLVLEEGTAKPEAQGGSRWIHLQIAPLGVAPRRRVRDAEVDRLGGTILRVVAG
jgi:hypothetical protein